MLEPVAEAVQVAPPGRLVEVEQLVLGARMLPGVRLLRRELRREEMRRRRDVGVRAVEADSDAATTTAAASGHSCRRAIASTISPATSPVSAEREIVNTSPAKTSAASGIARRRQRSDEQRDDEHVAGCERADECRDQPPEQVVVPRVEREVLRHAPRAVVVEAELVAEVADRAGAVPPPDADRVLLDRPKPATAAAGAEERPGDRTDLRAGHADRPSDEERDDGDEVVADRVQDALCPRCPPSALCGITA